MNLTGRLGDIQPLLSDFQLLRLLGADGGFGSSPEGNFEICRRFMSEKQIEAILKEADGNERLNSLASDILNTPEVEDDSYVYLQLARLHYVNGEREWHIISRGALRRPYAAGVVSIRGKVRPSCIPISIPKIIEEGAVLDLGYHPKSIHEIRREQSIPEEPVNINISTPHMLARNAEMHGFKYLPKEQFKELSGTLSAWPPRMPSDATGIYGRFHRVIFENIKLMCAGPHLPKGWQECDDLRAFLKYTGGEKNEIHYYVISRDELWVTYSAVFVYAINTATKTAINPNGSGTGYRLLGSDIPMQLRHTKLDLDFRPTVMREIKEQYDIPLEEGLTVKKVIGRYEAELVERNVDAYEIQSKMFNVDSESEEIEP